MSLYRNGIVGVTLTGVDVGAVPQTEKELNALNAELGAAIKDAVKTFPVKFTAREAATVLYKATAYGNKLLERLSNNVIDSLLSLFARSVNTKNLREAIFKADAAAYQWIGKIPIFGEGYVYEKGKNKEWNELNKLVLAVYMEVAGVVGERVASNEIKRELGHDLNPVTPVNIGKIVLIVVAVSGATQLIPKLLEQLKRVRRK